MGHSKEIFLTDQMEGFEEKQVNYKAYEVSFRRWLISEIDSGRMNMQEARDRFSLPKWDYKKIIRRWQDRYSDKLHISLQGMSTEERTNVKALEKRIKALEKQLEHAQLKNVALNTMIDIAENDYKLEIRKKSGPKQ